MRDANRSAPYRTCVSFFVLLFFFFFFCPSSFACNHFESVCLISIYKYKWSNRVCTRTARRTTEQLWNMNAISFSFTFICVICLVPQRTFRVVVVVVAFVFVFIVIEMRFLLLFCIKSTSRRILNFDEHASTRIQQKNTYHKCFWRVHAVWSWQTQAYLFWIAKIEWNGPYREGEHAHKSWEQLKACVSVCLCRCARMSSENAKILLLNFSIQSFFFLFFTCEKATIEDGGKHIAHYFYSYISDVFRL